MRVGDGRRTRIAVTALLAVSIAAILLAAQVSFAGQPAAAAATVSEASVPQTFEYVGSKDCKPCHLAQYKGWEKTRMAQAFQLLKPGERAEAKTAAGLDPEKDYTTDASCLTCHATGYGKAGGFQDIKTSSQLAGVTCEACHGAGKGYSVDSLMSLKNKKHSFDEVIAKGLVYPVAETTCQGCHNADSPHNAALDAKYAFDYTERVPKGTHKHYKLKYDHGALPAGVLFQKQR